MEGFIEGQAFLRPYDSAPFPTPVVGKLSDTHKIFLWNITYELMATMKRK
jgi:hypothetical protein